MPDPVTTENYFDLIKKNHENFLSRTMLTHIDLVENNQNNNKLSKCVEHIRSYYQFKAIYLNRSIKQQSASSKLGHGALSALLGIGVGSLFFLSSKSPSLQEAFNPISNINYVASGTFSALIGAGVSVIAYQAWLRSSKVPAVDDFEQFKDAMKKAGFSNDKYTELSAKLVKLFHFRECLLLGLQDNFDINFKDEFKEKYLIDNEEIDDDIINDAIEVFFLERLNYLFNTSFKNIYTIQDDEIKAEEHELRIIKWIKSLFENEEDRKKFTQELQIQFMEQCLNFLEQQMLEPRYLAEYPLLTTSITGLITSAITFCIISSITPFLIFTAINISLVVTVFSMMGIYYAVNNFDYIKFQRDNDNRLALGKTIKYITKECHRLRTLIKNVVVTTKDDLTQLDSYQEQIPDNGFKTEFHFFSDPEKFIAIGAASAWAREYATRYRHCKRIEIDLKERNEKIINASKTQTNDLYEFLIKILTSNNQKDCKIELSKIDQFIKHTKEYLSDKKNLLFINKFEIVEKIRQQILDIVSNISINIKIKLPQELEKFYTAPISQGGLEGSIFDLQYARNLSSPTNSFKILLEAAHRLNFFLAKNSDNPFILHGDSQYRIMLGLQNSDHNIDYKINSRNIFNYLNNSYNFLYSLDKGIAINQPLFHSNEFIIYRMLFLKQLANYVNPNNFHIEKSVKKEICTFVKEKLFIAPKVILDDIFNQGLFSPYNIIKSSDQIITDPLNKDLSKNDLEFISEAIRVDIAYTTKTITSKMLLDLEAKDFISTLSDNEKILLGYNNEINLTPEISKKYLEKILISITNSRLFILTIIDKNLTGNSNFLNFYLEEANNEISRLCNSIESLINLIKNQELPDYNSTYINTAQDALKLFQDELFRFNRYNSANVRGHR